MGSCVNPVSMPHFLWNRRGPYGRAGSCKDAEGARDLRLNSLRPRLSSSAFIGDDLADPWLADILLEARKRRISIRQD